MKDTDLGKKNGLLSKEPVHYPLCSAECQDETEVDLKLTHICSAMQATDQIRYIALTELLLIIPSVRTYMYVLECSKMVEHFRILFWSYIS